MSIDKAREILGYNPQHTWRNLLDEYGQIKATPEDEYALTNL